MAVILGPEGALLAIGLWLDQLQASSRLLAVGDVLEAEGGRYTGHLRTAAVGTPFTWVNYLKDEDTEHFNDRTAEQVRSAMADGTACRATMHLPGSGPATLEFAPTPEAEVPAAGHPVQVVIGADLLFTSSQYWDDAARAAAEDQHAAVMRYLKALTTTLDPAYAEIAIEGITADPVVLASGSERIGGDVFISHRLAVHPDLGPQLAEVARYCDTLEWETGTFYVSYFVLDDIERDYALQEAWSTASVTLGRLLTIG